MVKWPILLIFSMLILGILMPNGEAAVTCTIESLVTRTSGASINITTVPTGRDNVTSYNFSIEKLDTNQVAFSQILNTTTWLGGNTSFNISMPSGFSEQDITVTIFGYNQTDTGGTGGFAGSECTDTEVFAVDNTDIATPVLTTAGNNNPANEASITVRTGTTFNVTSGLANEQIDTATLFIGTTPYVMTAEDTNQTTYSIILTNVAEIANDWFIRVLDTDGTTTANSAQRAITFAYGKGVSGLTPEQAKSLTGKGTTTMIIVAIAVYLFLFTDMFGKRK